MPWSVPELTGELQDAQPGAGWQLAVPDQGVPGLLEQLNKQSIGVAVLKSGMAHAVVVDGLDAAGNIIIRDPWDGGSTYTMTPQNFDDNFMGYMAWKPKG